MRVSRKIFCYERKTKLDDWELTKKYQTTDCDITRISKNLLGKFNDIKLVPSFETDEIVISIQSSDEIKLIQVYKDMTPYDETMEDLKRKD